MVKHDDVDKKRTVGVERKQDNHQDDGEVDKEAKRKNGKPQKVQGKLGCTKIVSLRRKLSRWERERMITLMVS